MPAGAERYDKDAQATMSRAEGSSLPAVKRLMKAWLEPLTQAIEEEQEKIRLGILGDDRRHYGPYLLMNKPDQLAVLLMNTTMSMLMSGEKVRVPRRAVALISLHSTDTIVGCHLLIWLCVRRDEAPVLAAKVQGSPLDSCVWSAACGQATLAGTD